MPTYLHRGDEDGLTRRQAAEVAERLDWIAAELQTAAGWLDDRHEQRASAFTLCAVRDLLAAAHLVTPPTEQELMRLVEQLPPRPRPPREPDRERSWPER